MELLEKDGVTYVLEGVAGGGVPGPRPIKSEYSKWLYGDSRGYLEVTVKSQRSAVFSSKMWMVKLFSSLL